MNDTKSAEECDTDNAQLVQQLILKFPLLQFKAQYEVRVVANKDNCGDAFLDHEGEMRMITTQVNIISEAMKYLMNFFQQKEHFAFMRFSKDALRMLFITSMSIAGFLESYQERERGGADGKETHEVYGQCRVVGGR